MTSFTPMSAVPTATPRRFYAIIILLVSMIMLGVGYVIFSLHTEDDTELRMAMAAEMADNHLYEMAAGEYQKILDRGRLAEDQRAAVAYQLGNICFENLGDYERAAANFLMAQSLAPEASYAADAGRNLVACLERLGQMADAQRHLDKDANLDGAADSSAGGVVVAKVGSRNITLHEVESELQDMPPQGQAMYAGREGKKRFLEQYVGLELVRRAALRAGYDKSPNYRRELDKNIKGLLVNLFLEEQIRAKVSSDSTDVLNFYKLYKDSLFQGKPFSEVKQQVLFYYQNKKSQEFFSDYVNRLSQVDTVKMYPDSVK